VEFDPGTINQCVTPSTARKENKVQAGRVLFAVDPQLTQASSVSQEGHIVSQGNDVEDAWLGNESTNKQTGGTQEGNRLAHWQDQDCADNNTKHTTMLVSTKRDGMFTKACIKLNHGENIVAEAETCHQLNEKFLKDEDMFSPSKRINVFVDQHAPFPFLATLAPSNSVVILHGFRNLFVPFCYSHKNNVDRSPCAGIQGTRKFFKR